MGPCLDRRGRIPQALRNHQALGERQISRLSGRIPAVIVKPSYAHFLILSVGRLPLFGRLSLGVEKNLFNGSPVSGSFANGFPKPGARHRNTLQNILGQIFLKSRVPALVKDDDLDLFRLADGENPFRAKSQQPVLVGVAQSLRR